MYAADYTLDALQPSSYGRLRSSMGGLIDSVVTSPWFAALDLALPLLPGGICGYCGMCPCAWPLLHQCSGAKSCLYLPGCCRSRADCLWYWVCPEDQWGAAACGW
jgi:hypothetical protein